MRHIKIIGLCGRSGSGKGYVSKLFFRRGIPSVDTDAVYRELMSGDREAPSECLAEVSREFGEEVIAPDGSLDRRALADIVFAPGAQDRLRTLDRITHKYILAECLRRITEYEKRGVKAVILDAPLLFESGFDTQCDITVFVSAPEEVCISRICERDGISPYKAEQRLASQMSREELRRLCDEEIENGDGCDPASQVERICEKYGL